MENLQETADGGNAHAQGDRSYAEGGAAGDSSNGVGGDGGRAHAVGNDSVAIAGRGGRGGLGKGGPGGDATALGDGTIYYGGDGGESSQHDGRGGRGGVAQMMESIAGPEFARRARMKLPYGAPNTFPGRGGDTPDTPRYRARRIIVEHIKMQYFSAHSIPTEGAARLDDRLRMMPSEWHQALTAKHSDVWYDREVVPLSWINDQLRHGGHKWAASVEAEEYVFTDRKEVMSPWSCLGNWILRMFPFRGAGKRRTLR